MAFTNFAEFGGQSTGVVCQSEDLWIGSLDKHSNPAIAAKMICRESPKLEPSATQAISDFGFRISDLSDTRGLGFNP